VVGHTVLQWYLTGRHISRKQLNALYRQALEHGKQNAQRLASGVSRLRLPRRRRKQLPASGETVILDVPSSETSVALPPAPELKTCPHCGKSSALDALFCQYCGEKLTD